ncbi:MAG: sel1 repeat family protein [Methylobacillus sp.]|jgi:TPR repeat protein|nr:sel1 repeat family protein [Methylobacillus sp.]
MKTAVAILSLALPACLCSAQASAACYCPTGNCHCSGSDALKPPPTLDELLAQAEDGDANIQFEIGRRYEKGEYRIDRFVRKPDYAEAAKWYRKAAEQGVAGAQIALGKMYKYGYGVEQDDAQAVAWFRKAAGQARERGDYSGQRIADWMADMVAIWRTLHDRAEKGEAQAQYGLGMVYLDEDQSMYLNESVSAQIDSAVQAVAWLRKAAEQGNVAAQLKLASIFERGGYRNVEKNDAEAVMWYRKAAEQGNSIAQSRLGLLYELGSLGIGKDLNQAVEWYRKAAEQGEPIAIDRLRKMDDKSRSPAPEKGIEDSGFSY